MNSTTVFLAVFVVFLLFLAILDIFMVVSLIAPGDERKRMIVLQAAADTLLITVLSLIIDIIESLASGTPPAVNPFVNLGVTALFYFIFLMRYKKKYGG